MRFAYIQASSARHDSDRPLSPFVALFRSPEQEARTVAGGIQRTTRVALGGPQGEDMHAAQSLPRRCTRASAVPSDLSGVAGRAGRLAFALLIAAPLFTAGRPTPTTLPRTRSSTPTSPRGARVSATLRSSGRDSITMAATRRSRGRRWRRTTPPTRRRVGASRSASPISFPARSIPSAPTFDFRPARRRPVPCS